MTDLEIYFENTQRPWGKLFYKIIWEQLSFANSLKILDFGSGFGITANHMAYSNEVTAIEPNEQMCEMRFRENQYIQILGGLDKLKSIEQNSFDLIICHNVLEYIDDKDIYISELSKLLKPSGKLSLVKHNHLGKVMHKAVFENSIQEAIDILDGKPAFAQNFGEIKYYDFSNINNWINSFDLKLAKHLGIRTFYALHSDNSVRNDEDWINSMFELELKASIVDEFKSIASFNHILLEKVQ